MPEPVPPESVPPEPAPVISDNNNNDVDNVDEGSTTGSASGYNDSRISDNSDADGYQPEIWVEL